MHPAPTISVILPAYNVAAYIDQAARSILAQTFTDFELILIDDASTDQTPNKIRALATDSPRIKIITNARNLGIPKTRNIGAAAARGKYIAVQDGDDISLPARLAEQVAYLEANPDIALLGTARLRMSADSNINYNSGRLLSTRSVAKSPDGKTARPTFDDLLHANHFVHGSVMMRRNVFDEVDGYDETFALYEDYDLWLRIAKRYTVANLLQPLYALRSHPASVTKQNAANALLFQHLAVNRAKGEVDDAALAEIRAHGIEKYYAHLTPAGKIRYHKSLANTCYRNKQWHNALHEYRRLKQLGGANLKSWARIVRLQLTNATGGRESRA